jgi:hypothetical protein
MRGERLRKRLKKNCPNTTITLRIPIDVLESPKAMVPMRVLHRIPNVAEELHQRRMTFLRVGIGVSVRQEPGYPSMYPCHSALRRALHTCQLDDAPPGTRLLSIHAAARAPCAMPARPYGQRVATLVKLAAEFKLWTIAPAVFIINGA